MSERPAAEGAAAVTPAPEEYGGAVARRRRKSRGGLDRHRSPSGVPPVKPPPWEMKYIPVYFWVGGIAGGSWLAATLEDAAGDRDRDVVRAGRYVATGSTIVGTALLILDLGRRERFLNMLRVIRLRSPMSLGSWALASFGALSGLATMLQLSDDAAPASFVGRWSRGAPGRLVHAAGLPLALLVGSYTGVLIGATNVPSWAERWLLLGPLFVASSASSGLAAVSTALAATGGGSAAARRRLARAESIALAAELALGLSAHAHARARLPSAREEPRRVTASRWLTLAAGAALPLVSNAIDGYAPRRGSAAGELRRRPGSRSSSKPGSGRTLIAAGLALAGSLALRLLIMHEGRRSAHTPEDTWVHARNADLGG